MSRFSILNSWQHYAVTDSSKPKKRENMQEYERRYQIEQLKVRVRHAIAQAMLAGLDAEESQDVVSSVVGGRVDRSFQFSARIENTDERKLILCDMTKDESGVAQLAVDKLVREFNLPVVTYFEAEPPIGDEFHQDPKD